MFVRTGPVPTARSQLGEVDHAGGDIERSKHVKVPPPPRKVSKGQRFGTRPVTRMGRPTLPKEPTKESGDAMGALFGSC
jgi:hypothetical protein